MVWCCSSCQLKINGSMVIDQEVKKRLKSLISAEYNTYLLWKITPCKISEQVHKKKFKIPKILHVITKMQSAQVSKYFPNVSCYFFRMHYLNMVKILMKAKPYKKSTNTFLKQNSCLKLPTHHAKITVGIRKIF